MPALDQPIVLDMRSGDISNATAVERLGLRVMGVASAVLRPLGELGFSVVAKLVSSVLASKRQVCVIMSDDCRFTFPYGDGYWSILADRNHVYEPEVEWLLEQVRDVNYSFVDCGANYGFWSCRVSSERFGNKRSLAVELDPSTYGQLVKNASANSDRFDVLNRGVSDVSGQLVPIYGAKHEARSLVNDGSDAVPRGEVETVTLDELLRSGAIEANGPVVLKLDVEGVEVEAMNGANDLLERQLLIIYEDHGSDRSHIISRHVFDKLGMRVFGHSQKKGLYELRSVDELSRIKINRRRGYDFFATRDSFWLERLTSLFAAQGDRQDTLAVVA